MNLPTKLTILRLILSVFIIILLTFPFYLLGIQFKTYEVMGVMVYSHYIVAAFIFVVASITDFLDGYIARKYNLVTNTGKMLDAIADKVLVNSVLIILTAQGHIHESIVIIIVLRDIIVNAIKMEVASRGKVIAAISSGKIKTAALMIGITLVLISNLPFEAYNIALGDFLLYFAAIMSLISMFQYYFANKEALSSKNT